MRTIRIKLYKFNELSENAKQTALEACAYFNVDHDWFESTYEDAERIGLKITGFDLGRGNNCEGEFILAANEVAANILRDHETDCDTYKTAAKFMEEWGPKFAEYIETEEGEDELQIMEEEFLQSLLEDYRIILDNEYEYLTSKEAIIETIEANEYEFTQDGKFH